MGIQEIQTLLPHRYPFLLVDRIIECDDTERIVGIKNLTFNEPFFQGHFPGAPVMPGVLQIEAMAQVGGILLTKITGKVQVMYFLAIDKARFRRIMGPGDQMRIEVKFLKMRMNMARFSGIVTCDGELASEAELMFGTGRETTPTA
ncbi:MAG: 3-hydroxyacyl-[acyl-carrier-protein] dehydratase FabZ [Verrucomicrobia bacterium A1]|nr:MAG: 3-hydroxyacyl-[acyl-carrier-protein] dehydratase FabZ [Verrucomicrobia bacterium A1]